MIADTYIIYVCPHCEYWTVDNSDEELYHRKHLELHAGCGEEIVSLQQVVCAPKTTDPATYPVFGTINVANTTFEPQNVNLDQIATWTDLDNWTNNG